MSEKTQEMMSGSIQGEGLKSAGVKPDTVKQPHRILVLGAGFGGLYTAVYLDRYLKGLPDVRITVIDKHNFFLFTPMLHAAATGGLEPRYIAHSIRKIFRVLLGLDRFVDRLLGGPEEPGQLRRLLGLRAGRRLGRH